MFLLGFLVAIAFWPGAIDPASVLRWALMATIVPILLLIHAPRLPSPLQGLGLATLITVTASAAWSSDILNGIDQASHLIILAAVFCLGATVKDLRPAWAGLAAGMIPAAIVAFAQIDGWEGLFQVAVPGGLSVNKNMLSEAGVVAAVGAAAYGIGWAIPGALACAILGSSKAALAAAILVYAIWVRERQPVLAWSIFVTLACAMLAAVILEAPTLYQRFDMWNDALNHVPLTGHGLGSFAHDFPLFEHAHSEFIQAIYELGAFAVVPAAVLIYILKGAPHEPEFLVLVALLAIGGFSFPLHMPITGFAAALAAGRLAGRRAHVRSAVGNRRIEGSPSAGGPTRWAV